MERIKTGKEKQHAYKVEYSRYKKALSNEFYLEGLVIGYAVIEDRLISFLHYCGIVTRNKDNLQINKPIYPYIRVLLNKTECHSIRVKDIRVKMDIIEAILKLDKESANRIENETKLIIDNSNIGKKRKRRFLKGYMNDLYETKTILDCKHIIDLFSIDLESWRNNRNQLIHALLNNKVESVSEVKKETAEQGYHLSREIDNYLVKPIKKKATIRKKYNIQ